MMDAHLTNPYRAVPLPAAASSSTLLLRGVRRSIWGAFVLALANGLFLYFLPGQAEGHYAWPIKPSVNAAFLGAGYLSGVLPTALSLFVARYWRSVWALMWPFFTIGSVMLLATILHADRFRWHYPLTWVWTAVYVVIPPGVIGLWVWQQRKDGSRPLADGRLRFVRGYSWLVGGIVALLGLALLMAPDRMVAIWPWPITPLLARAFAAWYLQMATTLLFSAATLRQPHEALIPYAWLTTINLLLLLLPLIYGASMRVDRATYGLWLGLHTALLVGCGGATIQAWRLMRGAGQRL